MSKKLVVIGVLTSVMVAVLLIWTLSHRESEHVKRASGLLAIDETKSATTELKLAVRLDPSDERARALLLYAIAKGENRAEGMFLLYPTIMRVGDDVWPSDVPSEVKDEAAQTITRV